MHNSFVRLPARAARKDVSTLLMGNRHKLPVVAALAGASNGRINLGELASIHGVSPSVYYTPVKDLMALGLVRQVEAIAGQRRRWYERCGDAQVWEGLGMLTRALESFSAPSATES